MKLLMLFAVVSLVGCGGQSVNAYCELDLTAPYALHVRVPDSPTAICTAFKATSNAGIPYVQASIMDDFGPTDAQFKITLAVMLPHGGALDHKDPKASDVVFEDISHKTECNNPVGAAQIDLMGSEWTSAFSATCDDGSAVTGTMSGTIL